MLAEDGVAGYEFGNWYSVLAPAKPPNEIISTVNAAAVAALRNPDVMRRFEDLGYILLGDTPEEYGQYIKAEIERLGKLIRAFKLAAGD
jgi:tripartite-type tricarboxylate transporter receptor subunit TctC